MDPIWLAAASFPVLLILIFLRVPIGLSMLVVGLIGSWQVYGSAAPLLNQMKSLAYSQFSSHSLSIVPLFLLIIDTKDAGVDLRMWDSPIQFTIALMMISAAIAATLMRNRPLGTFWLPVMMRSASAICSSAC